MAGRVAALDAVKAPVNFIGGYFAALVRGRRRENEFLKA
jgi:hypothetical protein